MPPNFYRGLQSPLIFVHWATQGCTRPQFVYALHIYWSIGAYQTVRYREQYKESTQYQWVLHHHVETFILVVDRDWNQLPPPPPNCLGSGACSTSPPCRMSHRQFKPQKCLLSMFYQRKHVRISVCCMADIQRRQFTKTIWALQLLRNWEEISQCDNIYLVTGVVQVLQGITSLHEELFAWRFVEKLTLTRPEPDPLILPLVESNSRNTWYSPDPSDLDGLDSRGWINMRLIDE